ncbi:MAG: isoprenyl transferase [Ruminococcaceae bacterium]|nr:isoprenyl transferase [Oscillospiraceae bacterium]
MRFFGRREKSVTPDFSRLPQHIAIIMDGNGRWATSRALPRTAGHRAGSENFRRIATLCNDIGVRYLTVYAFSTENWSRPRAEVEAIMGLFREYLLEACEELTKKNISLRIVGDTSPLSDEIKSLIRETDRLSQGNTGLHVNVCLNYGGRAEIVHAAQALSREVQEGRLRPEDITAAHIDAHLDTAGVPDPDLIIRPSGELRTSNFLLWQSAYAEYYFTPVLWPDFDETELYRAIADFQGRSRRFGGIEKKK